MWELVIRKKWCVFLRSNNKKLMCGENFSTANRKEERGQDMVGDHEHSDSETSRAG